MSEPNFAGNIIVNLASLPDFLRTPILKKRMTEFFSKNEDDKAEIIINALNAGPTIPFPNFSKLFKTWLEVLAEINVENREDMFSNYFRHILKSPEKIILFNLDAIFEIFSAPYALTSYLCTALVPIKSFSNDFSRPVFPTLKPGT